MPITCNHLFGSKFFWWGGGIDRLDFYRFELSREELIVGALRWLPRSSYRFELSREKLIVFALRWLPRSRFHPLLATLFRFSTRHLAHPLGASRDLGEIK